MLLAAAEEDAKKPAARDLALELRRQAPSDEAFARAVHAFVKSRVRFVREVGELFQGSAYTLGAGAGDCDDHARAVYAIATAGGLPAVLAFLHHKGPGAQPTHAVAQLCPNGRCYWAETTVDAAFGEHPLAAAQRLGLLKARGDLATEVKIMKASDLPPAPSGYDDANDDEQTEADAAALERLGYPSEPGARMSACAPAFRLQVAQFQRAMGGLAVDGLIGPKTRARIARELAARWPGDPVTIGYLGAVDPQAARIAAARRTFDEALDAMGVAASAEGKEALLAVSWGETRFGDPATWKDSHNWGAVQYNPARGAQFVSWGYIEHGDHDQDGNPVTYRFQRYPSDLEGAKDKIRIALRTPAEKAAVLLESGAPEALAAAMYDAHYYTGVKGTREDRIAAYASMIRAGMATLSKTAGAPPSSSPLVSARAVGVGAILLGVGAAAAWYVATS